MQMSVKEFMSGDPVSISVGASALEAYELMLRHGIRHLPVLGPGQHVIGVITADDLAAALAVHQQVLIKDREPAACFRAFLNNNLFGFAVFAGLALDYLFAA